MFKVKILNQDEIRQMISMRDVIRAVEEVYRMKAQGATDVFPIVTHDFEVGISDFDIKSGAICGSGVYGIKAVSYFSGNAALNLPNLIGVLTIYDAATGVPIGIMDATYITCLRTGAAGAIGAKYLAREDSTDVLIIGAGKQAVFQMAALLHAMEGICNIRIYDGLAPENARTLAADMPALLFNGFQLDTADRIKFESTENLPDAVGKSDIIITVTPSRKPIIENSWVKDGTHFSCVGSDTSGKQEIDETIMPRARIFVDDITQCVNVGEIETAIKTGLITEQQIVGEIGQLLCGQISGRLARRDITVFDTTGIAIQDLITAKYILDTAQKRRIGTIVTI